MRQVQCTKTVKRHFTFSSERKMKKNLCLTYPYLWDLTKLAVDSYRVQIICFGVGIYNILTPSLALNGFLRILPTCNAGNSVERERKKSEFRDFFLIILVCLRLNGQMDEIILRFDNVFIVFDRFINKSNIIYKQQWHGIGFFSLTGTLTFDPFVCGFRTHYIIE